MGHDSGICTSYFNHQQPQTLRGEDIKDLIQGGIDKRVEIYGALTAKTLSFYKYFDF
jgi:hypothetical protein